MIIKGYILSLLYGFLCIAISAVVHKAGIKAEYTRKITHILVGFEWFILNHYFGASSHFLIVCLIFTLVILMMHKTKFVPAISSDRENSIGTIYYCIAMSGMAALVLFVPEMMRAFGIGVLCTSLGDGFAGLFGRIKKYNRKIYGSKTLFGSLACFVFCLLSVFLFVEAFALSIKWYLAIVIALFATEIELFAKKGIDNITVTFGASILSFIFASYPNDSINFVLPLLVTIPMIAFVYHKKALTKWGILAAVVLDISVSIAFGNVGFLILCTFFLGSLVADKIKKQKKSEFECRGAKQVLANGFLGIVFAIIYLNFPHKIWLVAFLAAFAEAFADTVSSGIGSRAKNAFDPFKFKSVEKGTSGGMSILGTSSALLASCIIASLSLAFYEITFIDAIIISLAGFSASVFDSFLGSLIQAKYECSVCGKTVEESIHCGKSAKKTSGISFVDNNVVNLLSTAFSSALAILMIFLIQN
jgi:uncharacterized protein (TIGR00297 family)